MSFMPRAIDEILGVEPLAHEAALHIDEAHKNSINVAVPHLRLQRFKC